MKLYLILLCFALSNLVSAQMTSDYAVYRKQHQTLSCQIVDSVIFSTVLHELLVLDTNQFDANLDLYHRDLSQAYACTWIFSKDSADLQNAVLQIRHIKNLSNLDHYNIAHYLNCLNALNRCEEIITHVDLYLSMTPTEEQLPNDEIHKIKNKCLYRHITDYKEYRKTQVKLTCTPQDSATIVDKLYDLLLLDTTQFTTNLDWYYQDLGLAYYKSFNKLSKDSILYEKSIAAYLKQKQLNSNDYWNIMHLYFILHDCANGEKYLSLYKKNTPREFYKNNKEQISRIRKRCER